jgi:hypothetical protein
VAHAFDERSFNGTQASFVFFLGCRHD